jgi:putative ABC transport system ATP-binding protein
MALHPFTIDLAAGELTALLGPSGSGKSTLLSILGFVLTPDRGRIDFEGQQVALNSEAALTRLRRTRIGYLFQYFNLLPSLNASENVALSLVLSGVRPQAALTQARALLKRVNLSQRTEHRVQQLSGGEMQRVALCRALIHKPCLLLADEPTGALDSVSGALILELLQEACREQGTSILMATHNEALVPACSRVLRLKDGRVVSDQYHNRAPQGPHHHGGSCL